MDTITQGVVTFDYLSGEQIHQFSIAMPANQAPIGVRDGAGFNAAINTLRQNVIDKLEDLRLPRHRRADHRRSRGAPVRRGRSAHAGTSRLRRQRLCRPAQGSEGASAAS
jgi:hypothetical protein